MDTFLFLVIISVSTICMQPQFCVLGGFRKDFYVYVVLVCSLQNISLVLWCGTKSQVMMKEGVFFSVLVRSLATGCCEDTHTDS